MVAKLNFVYIDTIGISALNGANFTVYVYPENIQKCLCNLIKTTWSKRSEHPVQFGA